MKRVLTVLDPCHKGALAEMPAPLLNIQTAAVNLWWPRSRPILLNPFRKPPRRCLQAITALCAIIITGDFPVAEELRCGVSAYFTGMSKEQARNLLFHRSNWLASTLSIGCPHPASQPTEIPLFTTIPEVGVPRQRLSTHLHAAPTRTLLRILESAHGHTARNHHRRYPRHRRLSEGPYSSP